jgi:hypothetical protein
MCRAWEHQQPVESLFKQTQDCDDYSESGSVLFVHPQQINVCYAQIFATGHFTSAFRRWNEKNPTSKKLGHNSKLPSPLHTTSISKRRVNLQPRQVTTPQTPMWDKLKNKWLKQPLELWTTWPQPLQRTEE